MNQEILLKTTLNVAGDGIQMKDLWQEWIEEIEIRSERKRFGDDSNRKEEGELQWTEEEMRSKMIKDDGLGRVKGIVEKGKEVWNCEILGGNGKVR